MVFRSYSSLLYHLLFQFTQHSKIDLDILEIKSLLSVELFDAALQIYQYGHNSLSSAPGDLIVQYRTLQSMATSSDRANATPYYDMFEFYNRDPDYAHSVIVDAFLGYGRFGEASMAQRAQIIGDTLSYQVVYMYALAQCADAVSDCKAGDLTANNENEVHSWDVCAAFLVGSLEGHTLGGSKHDNDGQLLYNLANVNSLQMRRDNEEQYAKMNERIVDAFWSGKGALMQGACSQAQRVVDELFQFSLVPLMQGVVRYAKMVEGQEAPWSNTDSSLGAAEAISRSILPVVCQYSEEDCKTLAENMLMRNGVKPVSNGTAAVVNALNSAIFVKSPYRAISCQDVGGLDGVDASCRSSTAYGLQGSSDGNILRSSWLGGLVPVVVALVVVAVV